jgi:hypothetical protein
MVPLLLAAASEIQEMGIGEREGEDFGSGGVCYCGQDAGCCTRRILNSECRDGLAAVVQKLNVSKPNRA